ncbi:DUF418 domain-containing protein [Sphingomonas lacunae]|uniref:DUF418 domain-containing protein n=1 Tax=Sphingomonas lacunae TaxID=2698828 RepID=A0A6M4AT60_9SPHN|nr:DUF418 domain-containing protein [Sphingomonas lacunae]QJQ32298.1 DUF418 domain-containing protein [Sphingomonas lacunae]
MTTATDTAAVFADSPPASRIAGLDATRGFAVMGILLMNIISFAMPENAYITPRHWGGDSGADLWSWAIAFVLFDSKMRGLFSIMFGASTLLVIQAAEAGGRSAAQTHYARMVVLALFGLAHFFFLWVGDILFLYACCGLVLYLFRDLSVKALTIWGILLIALNSIMMSIAMIMLHMGSWPGAPADLATAYGKFAADFAPYSAFGREDYELYRSDYATILAVKLDEMLFQPLILMPMYFAETLGLMLIGMALFKNGLLQGQWSIERLTKWATVGLSIGMIGGIALLALQFSVDLEPAIVMGTTFGFSVPFDVPMSIGYAALFMALAQRFASSPLIIRVAAAGRAAFTNYLGTSLLMTALFYGWGLGQFGEWSRVQTYGAVIAVWVIMLLWSKPWLDHFRFGPMEWLWRTLARGKVQPLRRTH